MNPDPLKLPHHFALSNTVAQALRSGQPVVALESAVITHGLPRPENLQLALEVEQEITSQGAVPATIAVLDGIIRIGLSAAEIEGLAYKNHSRKISVRDFAIAITRGETGGTTVAATLHASHAAGIRVFATGGIGGVHRGNPADVSADLQEIGRTPVLIVCAGAKAILDLPATMEYLETIGVPVIGYGTDELPAFYSIGSGLPVSARVDTPADAAHIARTHWEIGRPGGILVTVPPPSEFALPWDEVETTIQQALDEAQIQQVSGAALTPFLLKRVSELSGGASLRANMALLRQNARVAAQIAVQLAGRNNLLSG